MQNTRRSFIRLAIHLAMLIGLLLVLPEDRVRSEYTSQAESHALDNVRQTSVLPHSKSATGAAVTSYATQLESNMKPASDKTTHSVKLKLISSSTTTL